VHHYIVDALYEKGQMTEGAMLEILHSHSGVVAQPGFDDRRFGGINPYALGFAMMEDIKRICEAPTDEDRTWFPNFAGCQDWRGVLKDAWANYRDESFVRQYLSPHLMRKFRMFALSDDAADDHYTVAAIHNERGYEKVREILADSYDIGVLEPRIEIADVDLRGDRRLCLEHTMRDGIPLAEEARDEVLKHVGRLWGYGVSLTGRDAETSEVRYETAVPEAERAA